MRPEESEKDHEAATDDVIAKGTSLIAVVAGAVAIAAALGNEIGIAVAVAALIPSGSNLAVWLRERHMHSGRDATEERDVA